MQNEIINIKLKKRTSEYHQWENFVWEWDLAQIEWSKNLRSPQKNMLMKD